MLLEAERERIFPVQRSHGCTIDFETNLCGTSCLHFDLLRRYLKRQNNLGNHFASFSSLVVHPKAMEIGTIR